MPPAVGMVNESVTAIRPDLRAMAGFTVRVPKAFDIETAEGLARSDTNIRRKICTATALEMTSFGTELTVPS